MAYDHILAEEVRKALSSYKPEEKTVFGGLAFMVNGKMCVSVNSRPDHVMMVRIDPKRQDEAIKRKGASVAIMRGKQMNGWIFLTQEAMTTQEDFDYWVHLALDFNKTI